jgi:hypothetical protein
MTKCKDEFEHPPPKFDEDVNTIVVYENSKSGASNHPSMEV